MSYDANTGIYLLDGTEPAAPFDDLINMLGESTIDAIGNLKGLVQAVQAFGGNEFDNAGLDITQRGRTVFSTAGKYTADRIYLLTCTGGNLSFPEVGTGRDANYGIALTATSASNSVKWVQPYESNKVKRWRGQTRSFWAYFDPAVAGAAVTLSVESGTTADSVNGGTWSVVGTPTTFTPGTGGGWAKVTVTVPTNSAGLRLSMSITNNPTGSVITASMIGWTRGTERGIYAPKYASLAGELAECNRSYVSLVARPLGYMYTNGVLFNGTVLLPVKMRAVPTVQNMVFTVTAGAPGTVIATNITDSHFIVYNSAGNWTSGNIASLTGEVSAEL